MTDFIIIGNKNAAATKQMFPLIKDGKVRIGYNKPYFKGLEGLTRWYVTFPVEKEPLTLTATYSPEKYPKYDNYDAIEVSKIKDIPYDYEGPMGVPITILEHNLEGIKIIGRGGDIKWAEEECDFYTPPTENEAQEYKNGDKTWRVQNPYILKGKKPVCPYNRVFIILGILKGEFCKVDGNYVIGLRQTISGKPIYSRVVIRKKDIK